METKLLLKVEDHFLIEGRGLVVMPFPDLALTKLRSFKSFSAGVLICRPDGTDEHFEIRFELEHFNKAGGGEWHIVPILTKATKETVPIGSRLFASLDTISKLNS